MRGCKPVAIEVRADVERYIATARQVAFADAIGGIPDMALLGGIGRS
jgi:hypothetical protein